MQSSRCHPARDGAHPCFPFGRGRTTGRVPCKSSTPKPNFVVGREAAPAVARPRFAGAPMRARENPRSSDSALTTRKNLNGLPRAFGIRHQDGGRRRSQNLHVDPGRHHPRLYGRRDPGFGRSLRGDRQRLDRRADRRCNPVSGRFLHALSVRLRPSDRRVRAVSAGADRQASGRHHRRRAAQLEPGVHRQFRRRLYRGP